MTLAIGDIELETTRPLRAACSTLNDSERTTVVGFLGDVMLGRRVSEALKVAPPAAFLGDLGAMFSQCDGLVANLESPITENTRSWSGCWKAFHYRAIPAALDLLHAARIRAVTLANNHILDFEAQGLIDTCRHLDGAGIAYAGAGTTAARATAGALVRIGNMNFGLLGITDNMPEWRDPHIGGCTFYARIDSNPATFAAIRSEAERLRSCGAEVVVLSVHWGWMPIPVIDPPDRYRRFARRAIDCGIDIVHGHSSHLLRGVERYGHGLILYDTGNFMDDYWVLPGFPMNRSALFMLEFRAKTARRLLVLPIRRRRCHAAFARGRMRESILRDLARRCRRLGTDPLRKADHLTIELS